MFRYFLGAIAGWCLASSLGLAADNFVIGTTDSWTDLIPFEQNIGESHFARQFVAPKVVALDSKWNWVCVVCTEVPSQQNAQLRIENHQRKGKRLVTDWEIRKEFTWGNGRPVTGYDVDFTFQAIKKNIENPIARQLFPVEQVIVDQENPRKFRVIFRTVRADYAQVLAISLLPSYLKQLNSVDPREPDKEIVEISSKNHDLKQPYFYYGSYMVAQSVGNRLELTPNPYAAQKPNLTSIHIISFPTATGMVSELLAGRLQMIKENNLPISEIRRVHEGLNKSRELSQQFNLEVAPGSRLEQVMLNNRNPILADSNVRKALMLAIPRDEINTSIFESIGAVAFHLVHPRDLNFSQPLRTYEYDLAQANKLLDDADWERTANSLIRSKEGRTLELTLVTSGNAERQRMAQIIKKNWDKLGVDTKIETQEEDYFLRRTLRQVRFADAALFSVTTIPQAVYWPMIHAKEIPAEDNQYNGLNFSGWHKNEVNHILDDLVTEFSAPQRKEFTAAVMKHFVLELPMLPLIWRPTAAVIPRNLKGFTLPGHIGDSSIWAYQWQWTSTVSQAKH